jgi:hypothetical protein
MKTLKAGLVLAGVLALLCISSLVLATGTNDQRSGALSISLGDVTTGSVTKYSDTVDWWKFYVPRPGGIVAFLSSSETDRYLVHFYMYNSSMNLVGSDSRFSEFKPHFGTTQGGYYYLKVVVGYSSQKKVNYKIGVAFSSAARYLSGTLDVDNYYTTIQANEETWLFIVDSDDYFDPDIYVYYNDIRKGGSNSSQNIDYIHWDINFRRTYDIVIISSAGAGRYWIMRADE